LNASASIRDAVQRLKEKGCSAVVIHDERGPVVVTDRALLNTLVSEGEQPLSRVADRAFPGLIGPRTVLADAQRKYIVTENHDVTESQDPTALVEAEADAVEELARPSSVKFPDQRTITTVTLPLLKPEATIDDAVKRLRESKRSAVVIHHRRGSVVATDRSLWEAHKTAPDLALSRIADQAFPGIFGKPTELALAQRQYTVKEIQDGTEQVDVDTDAAQQLDQPSTLFPPPPAGRQGANG
jgi:CBS domain-containing protein